MSAKPCPDIAGVLLAGGRSRRMGQDKRFLELAGRTLLERALAVLDALFEEVVVSVAEATPELTGLGKRLVPDVIPDCATLGGLYSALKAVRAPRVFAAACDMPFLSPAVIEYLSRQGREADVVMANLSTGLQPTHACYSKACLPYLEQMAKGGHLRVQDLVHVDHLAVRLVAEEELRRIDSSLLSFMNVNTPADLEFARKLLLQHGVPSSPERRVGS